MPPETRFAPGDVAYQRAYAAIAAQALCRTGYLSATALQTFKFSAGPEVVDRILLHLQTADLLQITRDSAGTPVYDFLPLLEKLAADAAPDSDMPVRLARVYCQRHVWTSAIAELRRPDLPTKMSKEALYLLGYCFEQKGATQRAREYYERVLAVDYEYSDTRSRLAQLPETTPAVAQSRIPGLSIAPSHLPLPPAFARRYEIVREIGRGGAGVVYQAIDLKLRRDVALKVLYARDAAVHEHVLREARLAAQFHHPNLIDIYDVNIEARCITMEFVNGGTLQTLLRSAGRLPVDEARAMVLQLCQGLHVAHAAGVLHRDIKPANIFLTQQRLIKLGDFGIAAITATERDRGGVDELIRLSAMIGTLPYMSPEQVSGQPLTAASDIYALGIVWYEMLMGAPPFTRGDISYHHHYTAVRPPGISDDLDALLMRCLAKDPAARFQSANDLRAAIQLQAQAEQARLDQYRNLLTIAMLDHEVSAQEHRLLQLKRTALGLSGQEACRVEQELGFTEEVSS